MADHSRLIKGILESQWTPDIQLLLGDKNSVLILDSAAAQQPQDFTKRIFSRSETAPESFKLTSESGNEFLVRQEKQLIWLQSAHLEHQNSLRFDIEFFSAAFPVDFGNRDSNSQNQDENLLISVLWLSEPLPISQLKSADETAPVSETKSLLNQEKPPGLSKEVGKASLESSPEILKEIPTWEKPPPLPSRGPPTPAKDLSSSWFTGFLAFGSGGSSFLLDCPDSHSNLWLRYLWPDVDARMRRPESLSIVQSIYTKIQELMSWDERSFDYDSSIRYHIVFQRFLKDVEKNIKQHHNWNASVVRVSSALPPVDAVAHLGLGDLKESDDIIQSLLANAIRNSLTDQTVDWIETRILTWPGLREKLFKHLQRKIDAEFAQHVSHYADQPESLHFQSENLNVAPEHVQALISKTKILLQDLCDDSINLQGVDGQSLPDSLRLLYRCSPLAKGMILFLAYQQLSIELSSDPEIRKSLHSLNEGELKQFNSDALFPLFHHVILHSLGSSHATLFAEIRYIHRFRRLDMIWQGESGWGLTNFCSAIEHISNLVTSHYTSRDTVQENSPPVSLLRSGNLDLSGKTEQVILNDLNLQSPSKPLPAIGNGLYALVGGIAKTLGVDTSPRKSSPIESPSLVGKRLPQSPQSNPLTTIPGLDQRLLSYKSYRNLSIEDVQQLFESYQMLAKWVLHNRGPEIQ